MDPKELRGRELAAWALGTLGYDGEPMKDLGQISKAVFWMAAEIERLCAEPKLGDNEVPVYRGSKPMGECVVTEQSVLTQASRDAAALDALAAFDWQHWNHVGGMAAMVGALQRIITSTGRKISP